MSPARAATRPLSAMAHHPRTPLAETRAVRSQEGPARHDRALQHVASVPTSFSFQLAKEPRLCELEVAIDGLLGHVQDLGGLFHAEAAEKTQFDHLTLPFVLPSQCL